MHYLNYKEQNVSIHQIKHWNGNVLHTIEADNIKAAMEALVKSEANLSGVNLWGANLSGVNLRGANIWGANLWEANLSGVNLSGANLRGTNLSGANLRGADLSGADLRGANLSGADLCGANLRGVDLRGVDLRGANLRGATYRKGTPLTKNPIQIDGLTWPILILDAHLKIGCELHTFVEWEAFTDKEISRMEEQALTWWKQHKEAIFAVIKACR